MISKTTKISEPASELERLIADLSRSGPLVFVFGDDAASWIMDVRVDEVTGVRFVREPYPFQPHFPGHEVLIVVFLGPGGDTALHCYIHDLYRGRRMRPEKLAAWQALRERYGNRDESRVDRGTLLPPPA